MDVRVMIVEIERRKKIDWVSLNDKESPQWLFERLKQLEQIEKMLEEGETHGNNLNTTGSGDDSL